MTQLKAANNPTSPDALDILSNEIVIMFGKLKKRGKINTAWKQRWCELAFLADELILSYYVSKRNKKLCGCIEVVKIYKIQVIDYDINEFKDYNLPQNIQKIESNNLKNNNLKYTFSICTLGRDYILSAPNKTDFIQWIELFNKYVFPKIIFNGYLDIKKEKTLNEWNKYYFELNEYKQIKYYKTEKKNIFYGSIPLTKINQIKNGYVYDNDHVFTFHLHAEKLKKKWVLCYLNKSTNTYIQNLESKNMREIWQNEIEKICGKEKIQIIQIKNIRKQRPKSDLTVINSSHAKRKSKKISKKPRLSVNLNVIIPGLSSSKLIPDTSYANVDDGAHKYDRKTII